MRIIKIFLVWAVGGLIGIGSGCGKSTTGTFKPGRLYVVNNVGYNSNVGITDRYIEVTWEEEIFFIPMNMDRDGNPTGAGAVLLTPEPLPGGTQIDFTYLFIFEIARRTMQLSEVLAVIGEEAVIDGDITIEIYSARWDPMASTIIAFARVIKGKYDGIHRY
jgi:hypothetical protein